MIRLAQRLAFVAAILPGFLAPAAWAQSAPAKPSIAGAEVRNFPPAAYHADRQNWAIVQDNRGILYFGNTSGVLEFDGSRWRRIELPGGHGAFALGKSADGRILVGGEGEVGWLAPDQNGSMVYVSRADDLPQAFRSTGDHVIQILDTPIGHVFVSDHWLFVRSANGAPTVLRSGDHFLQAAWFHDALYVLDSGRGLTRLDGGLLQNVAGGADTRGLTMLVTGEALLIPSYSDGLVRYAPGSANPWQVLHVTGWSAEDNTDVISAVALNQDLVALGTAKHGVALIDTRRGLLQVIGPAEGLADPHVYSVSYDHSGGLWLALNNGVALVSLSLPKDAAAVPFNAWVRSVVGTSDERLLFGGTSSSSPGGVQQLRQNLAQMLKFPYDYNAFRFDYSANGLQASGDMEFQTYMQGVDNGWTGWSTRTEREFTQLGAGKWVFRVRSRKPDGEISGERRVRAQDPPGVVRHLVVCGPPGTLCPCHPHPSRPPSPKQGLAGNPHFLCGDRALRLSGGCAPRILPALLLRRSSPRQSADERLVGIGARTDPGSSEDARPPAQRKAPPTAFTAPCESFCPINQLAPGGATWSGSTIPIRRRAPSFRLVSGERVGNHNFRFLTALHQL